MHAMKPAALRTRSTRDSSAIDVRMHLVRAEVSEGVLNAKLADFGLHALVEATDRNETVRKMCAPRSSSTEKMKITVSERVETGNPHPALGSSVQLII